MNSTLEWNDLKVVLAIAEAGSLSGAGRTLGVSHATVFRRLGDIEGRLGVSLFQRGRSGYVATVAGEEAAAAARRVAAEVQTVERRLAGQDLRPSGRLRVTTTDTLMAGIFAAVFTGFRRAFPEIALEVAVSNQLFSLSKREAEVAVRPAAAPPEALVGRKVGVIAQAVYGAPALVKQLGRRPDLSPAALSGAPWVGPDEAMAYRPLERWMAAAGHDAACGLRVDTMLGMAAAAAAGAGLAVLPCYLAEGDARLRRIGKPIPELATDLWLLTHPDLRRAARIRAFMDFAAAAAKAQAAQFNGVHPKRES